MAAPSHVIPLRQPCDEVGLSSVFKAAGDELRLQILRVMAQDSYGVSELCDIFDIKQSALSHHLRVLLEANLLNRRKDGTNTFYRRALPSGRIASLHQQLLDQIDMDPIAAPIKRGVERVQCQRENNSVAFFRDNAGRFRQHQELVAPWSDYSEATLQLLDRLYKQPLNTIVEIGVGEGWLLPALRQRASSVVALDLSAKMLDLARDHAAHLTNIRFVHGSTDKLIQSNLRADAVVANMVLHHTPDPQRILSEAAALLAPGGSFIISELCAHDQAWAREHCGDIWLRFTSEQLQDWASHADLELSASVFLAQRNGFQIQIQHLKRC